MPRRTLGGYGGGVVGSPPGAQSSPSSPGQGPGRRQAPGPPPPQAPLSAGIPPPNLGMTADGPMMPGNMQGYLQSGGQAQDPMAVLLKLFGGQR